MKRFKIDRADTPSLSLFLSLFALLNLDPIN